MYLLKTSNINVDSMRKINDFKINALKIERVRKTLENLNSFYTTLKNAKNDANVLKMYFLDFQCFSLFLDFSENLSKHGSKIG